MVNSARRLLPNLKRYFSSTHLLIKTPAFTIRFQLQGRLNVRQRRAIAAALFRDLRPKLKAIEEARIHHADADPAHFYRDLDRGISHATAPTLATPKGKLGMIIRMRRLALGMTQRELAVLTDLARTHISRIERGQYLPHRRNAAKLEKALAITLPHYWNLALHQSKQHNLTLGEGMGRTGISDEAAATRASIANY